LTTTGSATVTSTNTNAPIAAALTRTVQWRPFTANGSQFDILAANTDADGDTLTLTINTAATAGATYTFVNGGRSMLITKSNWTGVETVSLTDIDGDSLTFTLVDASAAATVTKNPDNLSVTYMKASVTTGTETFPCTVSDGLNTATCQVPVNVYNTAPVVKTIAVSVAATQCVASVTFIIFYADRNLSTVMDKQITEMRSQLKLKAFE